MLGLGGQQHPYLIAPRIHRLSRPECIQADTWETRLPGRYLGNPDRSAVLAVRSSPTRMQHRGVAGVCLVGRAGQADTSPSHPSLAGRSPGRPLPRPVPGPEFPSCLFLSPSRRGNRCRAGLGKSGRPSGEEEGSLVGQSATDIVLLTACILVTGLAS